MRNFTVRAILENAKELAHTKGVSPGTTFTALVVIDGVADAMPPNTIVSLAAALVRLNGDAIHKFEIETVTVSQLTAETVSRRNLFAVIDYSSANFWVDPQIAQSLSVGLAAVSYLLNRTEHNFAY